MATTFTSDESVSIDPDGPNVAESSVDVSGIGTALVDVEVMVAIDHTFTSDLVVVLVTPDARQVVLARNVGGSGDDFDTTFADSAGLDLADGEPPFTGRFRPAESLDRLSGLDPNGRWRILVIDQQAGDGGALIQWALSVTTTDDDDPSSDSGHPIEVVVRGGLTASQVEAFDLAAQRWGTVLRASAPSVLVDGDVIDGVRIEAAGVTIDGPEGILGRAGPIALRPDSMIPATGLMEFDTGDLATLEMSGNLVDVITHEMGHVLGIGTLWASNLLVGGSGSVDPTFTGPQATAEFALLIDAADDQPVPIANTGGAGTREGHWREAVFGNELMTGFVDANDNPLSRLTIASLADIGYSVDIDAADPYELPTAQELALMGVGSDRTFQQCCTVGSIGRGPDMVLLPADAIVDA